MKKHILQVLCGSSMPFYILLFITFSWPVQSNEPDSWQLEELLIKSQSNGVQVNLGSLTWQENQSIKSIDYWCPGSLSIYPKHECNGANLSFDYGGQIYAAIVNSVFNFQESDWKLALSTIDEQLAVTMSSDSDMAKIKFQQLNIESVVSQLLPNAEIPTLPTGFFDGELLFDIDQLLLKTSEHIFFKGINYEYSDDVIVAELAGEVYFEYDIRQQLLSYQLKLEAGEMLLNEVYVDFSGYPITVSGEVVIQESGGYLISTNLINKQSLAVSAQVYINKSFEWSYPSFTAVISDSYHFNQQILGNVLGIYGFGNSDMSGQFKVTATSKIQSLDQWSIVFDDYYFLNETRKIAAEALNGRIDWHQDQASNDSMLSWQSLQLAGLPIDAADINFNFSQDEFELIGSQQFPVFNGAIKLAELKLSSLFSDSIDMSLNASILPISLKLITEKMGWPIMAGSISGDIPGMVKQGSVIKFLGALDLEVFEGDMLVENLSLERLFGVAPVIAADVKFDGFDLSLVTETFGFGLITGKLSGVIDELRITNWKTDRLDAEVYTVKTKGIKQIISQRAIDNISSLGGIKGAISKTFLRFFEDFRYKKIKLSCKLHNSVCAIGGLRNQNNQFVIVEGGGIPKINIVGYVRSINWEEFVNRLINANYDN